MIEDRSDRICVIGAGSSGLTAAKNLAQRGFRVDVLEKAALSQFGNQFPCLIFPDSDESAQLTVTHTRAVMIKGSLQFP